MPTRPYGTICAITKGCEVIEPRWTLLILNQMWAGYTRFNDIRRAVGNISPGVLSKRLTELENAGLIDRIEDRAKGTVDYVRTAKAVALEPMMDALSIWALRHIEADVALADTDVTALMGALCRKIQTGVFPKRRVVMRFHFKDELGPNPTHWLVVEPGAQTESCVLILDLDVDLYIETSKISLCAVIHGRSTIAREVDAGRLFLSGDAMLERSMGQWLPRPEYPDLDGIRMLPAAE